MSDEINYDEITCEEILRKIVGVLARHASNIENTMAMMRNGQFIDAHKRLAGSRDGLNHVRIIVEGKLESIDKQKDSTNETNTN